VYTYEGAAIFFNVKINNERTLQHHMIRILWNAFFFSQLYCYIHTSLYIDWLPTISVQLESKVLSTKFYAEAKIISTNKISTRNENHD